MSTEEMSELKVADRVIARWSEGAYTSFHLPSDAVPDGEHTITEIDGVGCRLAGYPNWWYPLSNITKVEDATLSELKECAGNISFRDECAMRAMQADWSSNGVADPAFVPACTDVALEKWATLYYRMADAMLEARKK